MEDIKKLIHENESLKQRLKELDAEIQLKDKKIEILTRGGDNNSNSKTLSESEDEVVEKILYDESNSLIIKDGEIRRW